MSEETTCAYHVRRREFLNEDLDLPAFIIGIVEDTRAIPDDAVEHWSNGQIALDLGDCYRRVRFDFQMYDAAARANSLRKINLIADVVNAVRYGIAAEVASRNARPVPESDEVEEELTTTEVEQAQTEEERARAEIAPPTVNKSTAHFFSTYITRLGL